MVTVQIYLSDEEKEKVAKFSKEWGIAHYEVIRKMIREFKEEKEVE